MKILKTIAGVFLMATAGAQAATVSFSPNPLSVGLGSVFSLEIVGTEFTGTEGGGAAFIFDPEILQVNSIAIDSIVWDVFTSSGTTDNVNGSVDGITVAAFVDPGANFTVATIEFEAVGIGTTALILLENPLNPWASGGAQISPTLVSSSLTVAAVPILPTGWLFGSGLGLLAWFRQRQSSGFH